MTDQDIIIDSKKGSRSAQEILVRRHYKLVFSFLYRMIGDKELAKDLTQETFIKVMKNLSKYKPTSDFKSWLLTVAANNAKDYLKSKAHRENRNTYEVIESEMRITNSVSSIFEKNEKRKEIRKALLGLPDFQREAILLKYYNEMKISEIASITNSSVPTVKSRLRQGLEKLKLQLTRGEKDERNNTNG
jgi:RNA polymerase sigma factor (sigma-70 family)